MKGNNWPGFRSAVDSEFLNHIQIFDHIAELRERNFSIEVSISFNDSSINQLLQLDIIQIVSNHHFEHCKQLSIWDVAVIVDIINLESKLHLFFMGGSSWKRVEPLDKF